jgi:hypothetical protein
MPEPRTVQVSLSFPGEPPTPAVAALRDWTPLERTRRAVFGLALMWCLAGIFLPIPPIHWVLVPACLLAGPVLAVLRFSEKTRIETLTGACPRCKVDRVFRLNVKYAPRRSFHCDGCGNLVELAASE